jgi:glutaminyl-peptide cyclotransferase
MNLRVAAVVMAFSSALAAVGCTSSETAAQDRGSEKSRPRDQFAADQAVDMPKPADFDAKRAMKYLTELCAIGTRISGSDGMRKQQALLKDHFETLGGKVTFQEFEAEQASQPRKIPMVNIIVAWRPDAQRRILLCTHYDTRPIADQEPDRRKWNQPFVSANDGTCGVAWLMELAHHMKDLPLNVGVDFAIFDGEECIYDRDRDVYFFGSKHFATRYREQRRESQQFEYAAGALLDLFAGKGAKIKIEPNSLHYAGSVVEDIWKTARSLGVREFREEEGMAVEDDHIALNNAGIPTVDLIDFDYKHWHRLTDLPENCSEESMAAMAKVLTVWMQRVK